MWNYAFPINKSIWTSSYVVFTAGMACLRPGHDLLGDRREGLPPMGDAVPRFRDELDRREEKGPTIQRVILPGMNRVYKNVALWMVIGLIVILLFTVFQGTQQNGQEQPNFSDFLKAVEQGRVESVGIRGNLGHYTLKGRGPTHHTY